MSYTKKTWKTGDTITAADLNNIEEGTSANAAAIEKIEQSLTTYVGADVPRKAAETITPGTANQTIAANQYLTGAQTIKGDGNLSAGNIKKGVSIFGVSGTLEAGSSGGMVSKSGTVTGGGSGVASAIATGLSKIALLVLTVDGIPGLGFLRGYYCADWSTERINGVGVTAQSGTYPPYTNTYGVSNPTVSVSGGDIVLAATSTKGEYLAKNTTYKWYAVGKA